MPTTTKPQRLPPVHARHARQRGVSTVELLVLLAIIALGLIATVRGMQGAVNTSAHVVADHVAALRPYEQTTGAVASTPRALDPAATANSGLGKYRLISETRPAVAPPIGNDEGHWWDKVLESAPVQTVAGFGKGLLRTFTFNPLSRDPKQRQGSPAYEWGAGAAQMLVGTAELLGGGAALGAGLFGDGASVALALPSFGGSAAIAVPSTVAVVVGGAVALHGGLNLVAGYNTMANSGVGSGSNSDEQQQSSSQSEAARHHALGEDPATGSYRPNEEATAVRLEGKTGSTLERYQPGPGQKGDWVDPKSGTVYDGCSPAPNQYFDNQWGSYVQSLEDHLSHPTVDKVVVDVTDLNLVEDTQLDKLTKYLDEELSAAEKAKIVRIGF